VKTPKSRILVRAILIFATLSPSASHLRAFAQAAQVYKVGDVVQLDPQLTHQWSEGTITAVTAYGGRVYGYAVRVNSGPAGAGNSLRLSPAHFRPFAANPGAQNSTAPQGGANGSFRVGDLVEADFFGTGHWIEARIIRVNPAQGPVGQYTVEDASTPGAHGAQNDLAPRSVRPWPGANAQAAAPAPAAWQAQSVEPARPVKAADQVPTPAPAAPRATGQFKVGDRVLSSINSSSGDYQPCTIMGPLSQNVYPVRCDPYKGRPFTDWGAFPQFIRPWPGATPAPVVQACSFSVPGGTVTRNSPPTAQTFQRVIYNMDAVAEHGKWGMTFTRFDIGTPVRNSVISNGMGGVELARPKAPQGAIIYPIKGEYVSCAYIDASYDQRDVVDENWACMKNNDGDWDCAPDSTPNFIKQERVPK